MENIVWYPSCDAYRLTILYSADRVGLVAIRLCKLGVSRLEREDVAGKFATPVGPFLR